MEHSYRDNKLLQSTHSEQHLSTGLLGKKKGFTIADSVSPHSTVSRTDSLPDHNFVTTGSLLGSELEPEFTHSIANGLVQPHKVRGRKGTVRNIEDMIVPQDQALLEWKNIEFFVPVKKPPTSE